MTQLSIVVEFDIMNVSVSTRWKHSEISGNALTRRTRFPKFPRERTKAAISMIILNFRLVGTKSEIPSHEAQHRSIPNDRGRDIWGYLCAYARG